MWGHVFRVRSGQGKLEKSGKIQKGFPVTRKSGNIDYSPIVREFEDSWVENQNSSHNQLFFEAEKINRSNNHRVMIEEL